MSIISEALKKIQQTKNPMEPQKPIPIQITSGARPASRFYWTQIALLILAIVIAVVSFVNFQRKTVLSKLTSTLPVEQAAPALTGKNMESVSISSSAKGNSKLAQQLHKEFNLSGIALIDGKALAIINGDVLEVGQQIRGARLVRVSQEAVTLDYRGEEVRLTLR